MQGSSDGFPPNLSNLKATLRDMSFVKSWPVPYYVFRTELLLSLSLNKYFRMGFDVRVFSRAPEEMFI